MRVKLHTRVLANTQGVVFKSHMRFLQYVKCIHFYHFKLIRHIIEDTKDSSLVFMYIMENSNKETFCL